MHFKYFCFTNSLASYILYYSCIIPGIPFISVKDISGGKLDFSDCKYITEEEHCELYSRCNPEYGDILLTKVGTTGIPVIVDTTNEFSLFVSVALLKFNQEMLSNEYLACLINSPLVQKQAEKNTRGVGNKNWVMRDIANTLIVIPPLLEQQRIVSKLQKILPFVDNYAHAYSKAKKLNNGFPNLLKKSILQEAVQGKLVPQDPNDEPASILLERIRAEKERLIKAGKIKRDKHESVIFRRDNSHYEKCGSNDVCIDDEIPFDIPNSWCWTRLDNIITVRGGKRLPKGEKLLESPTDHVYIRVTDMKNNSVDLNDLHYIDDKVYREISNYIITKDDIYIVIVGSTIGKVGIVPNELDGMNLTENAARLTPYLVDKEYLLLALQTEYLQRQFLDKTNQVGQPKLALIRLKTSLIPMPPLEEQKRIAQMYKHLLLPVSDL